MRRLRVLSLLILLCSVASIGYIRFKHGQNNDKIAPVISMEDGSTLTPLEISVKDDESVLLSGATAKDNKDGDVTDSIAIDNISTFNGEGIRYVTLAAFDSSNNVGKSTREITYTDYRPTHFDITEALIFNQGDTDYLENITADDVLDGDMTGSIHFADNTSIMSDEAGDYDAEIQVKNSAGDVTSLPVTITVLDGSYDDKPRIQLKHYVRYIKKNGSINYKKLIKRVKVGGTEYKVVDGNEIGTKTFGRDLIHISDENVNYKKAGIYTVTYKTSVKQVDETVTGTTKLTVVVED